MISEISGCGHLALLFLGLYSESGRQCKGFVPGHSGSSQKECEVEKLRE